MAEDPLRPESPSAAPGAWPKPPNSSGASRNSAGKSQPATRRSCPARESFAGGCSIGAKLPSFAGNGGNWSPRHFTVLASITAAVSGEFGRQVPAELLRDPFGAACQQHLQTSLVPAKTFLRIAARTRFRFAGNLGLQSLQPCLKHPPGQAGYCRHPRCAFPVAARLKRGNRQSECLLGLRGFGFMGVARIGALPLSHAAIGLPPPPRRQFQFPRFGI